MTTLSLDEAANVATASIDQFLVALRQVRQTAEQAMKPKPSVRKTVEESLRPTKPRVFLTLPLDFVDLVRFAPFRVRGLNPLTLGGRGLSQLNWNVRGLSQLHWQRAHPLQPVLITAIVDALTAPRR